MNKLLALVFTLSPLTIYAFAPDFDGHNSKACQKAGGILEMKTCQHGVKESICKFKDGSECEANRFSGISATECKQGIHKNFEEEVFSKSDLGIHVYTSGYTADQKSSDVAPAFVDESSANYFYYKVMVENSPNTHVASVATTLIVYGDQKNEIPVPSLAPGSKSQEIIFYIPINRQGHFAEISTGTTLSEVYRADNVLKESFYRKGKVIDLATWKKLNPKR